MLIGLSIQAHPKMKSYRQSVVAERENHFLQRQFTQSQVVNPKYACILCSTKCVQLDARARTHTMCKSINYYRRGHEYEKVYMGGAEQGEARVDMVRI